MSDWDIDIIIDGSFMKKGVLERINDFLQPCFRESLNPEYIGIFIRMLVTMLTVATVLYIVFFNLVNPKIITDINNYYDIYAKNFVIHNLMSIKKKGDIDLAKYMVNLPFDLIKEVNSQPDPNFTRYNELVYKVFRIVLGVISGLLLVTIIATKNIACIDYSVMAAFIECIIILGMVGVTCFLVFSLIGSNYSAVSRTQIKNIIIDRIITNSMVYRTKQTRL